MEIPHAYPELTVRENLEVARRLHPGTPPEAVGQIIERLGLAAYADRRAGTLSHGNAQRLGLAKALLHDPRLLMLDEPANGLDPAGIVEIRELLLELTREQGVTVFMSSHILAEVARLAGRIGIIHEAACCRSWTSTSWSGIAGGGCWCGRGTSRRRSGCWRRPGSRPRSCRMAPSSSRTRLRLSARTRSPACWSTAGVPPTQLLVEEEELEQYFLRLVGMERRRKMNDLSDMIWIELRKALRSRMPLLTALGSLFMPLGIAFLIFVATNPEISGKLGLVSAKANLMAYAADGLADLPGLVWPDHRGGRILPVLSDHQLGVRPGICRRHPEGHAGRAGSAREHPAGQVHRGRGLVGRAGPGDLHRRPGHGRAHRAAGRARPA